MSGDANMMQDIAQGEAWLAQRLDDAPFDGRERVRMRVRIELGERWMRSLPDAAPAAGLAARLRGRVRAELAKRSAATSGSPLRPTARRTYRYASAMLRVAAAVGFMLLAATPFGHMGSSLVADGHPLSWDTIVAAISIQPSEDDVALMSVGNELDALERSLYQPDAPLNADDALLHDVDEELDRMMSELGSDAST